MQTDRNFLEELKHQYKFGGMHVKLIFINSLVFLLIGVLGVIGRLSMSESFDLILQDVFT